MLVAGFLPHPVQDLSACDGGSRVLTGPSNFSEPKLASPSQMFVSGVILSPLGLAAGVHHHIYTHNTPGEGEGRKPGTYMYRPVLHGSREAGVTVPLRGRSN